MENEILFIIETPLNIRIRLSFNYWNYIVSIKHPIMRAKENLVKEILNSPDEIRKSNIDSNVYLYYKLIDRLYCVVCKHIGEEGFVITTYPTDKVKEGEIIWTK